MATLFAQNSPEALAKRQRILTEGLGYFAETYPQNAHVGSSIAVDGTVYGMAVGLLAGDVVTSLSMRIQTAGTGTSLAKMGVYTKSGSLLAATADLSSTFNSQGVKTGTLALQSNGQPLTIPTDDVYYLAFIAKTATTMPTPIRGAQNFAAVATAAVGSGVAAAVTQSGQTDLPSSATLAASAASFGYWIGVS